MKQLGAIFLISFLTICLPGNLKAQNKSNHELSIGLKTNWYTNSFRFPYQYNKEDIALANDLYTIPFQLNYGVSIAYFIHLNEWIRPILQANYSNLNYSVNFPEYLEFKDGDVWPYPLKTFDYSATTLGLNVGIELLNKKWHKRTVYGSFQITLGYNFIFNSQYSYTYRNENEKFETAYKLASGFWNIGVSPGINWALTKKQKISISINTAFLGKQSLIESELFYFLIDFLKFNQRFMPLQLGLNISYTYQIHWR